MEQHPSFFLSEVSYCWFIYRLICLSYWVKEKTTHGPGLPGAPPAMAQGSGVMVMSVGILTVLTLLCGSSVFGALIADRFTPCGLLAIVPLSRLRGWLSFYLCSWKFFSASGFRMCAPDGSATGSALLNARSAAAVTLIILIPMPCSMPWNQDFTTRGRHLPCLWFILR